MTPLEFMAAVLPSQPCVAVTLDSYDKDGKTHSTVRYHVYDTQEDLINDTSTLQNLGTKKGVYFVPSTPPDTHHRGQTNKLHKEGWHSTVVAVDVDLKVNTHHEDVKHLATHIVAKLNDGGHKPHYVVMSGGGVHLYFKYDRLLSADEHHAAWTQCKNITASVAEVTVDASPGAKPYGFFRLPGSVNPRTSTIVKAYDTGTVSLFSADDLNIAAPAADPLADILADVEDDGTADTDTVGELKESAPVAWEDLAAACPQMQRILVDDIDSCTNDEWVPAVGLMRFVEDGNAQCHLLSSKDSRYDAKRIDSIMESDVGPPNCTTLSPALDGPCYACPYRSEAELGDKKNPIIATRRASTTAVAEAAVEEAVSTQGLGIKPMAWPDNVRFNGPLTQISTRDDEGDVTWHELYDGKLFVAGKVEDTVKEAWNLLLLRDGKLVRIGAGNLAASKPDLMASEFANRNMMLTCSVPAKRALQYTLSSMFTHAPEFSNTVALGFAKVRGRRAFVGLKETVFDDGTRMPHINLIPKSPVDGIIRKYCEDDLDKIEKGTANEWVQLVGTALGGTNDHNKRLQRLAVMVSLSSPLADVLDLANSKGSALFSMVGPTGCGKTSAQRIACSVWGYPVSHLIASKDSANGVGKVAEAAGNLLMVFDEVSNSTKGKGNGITSDNNLETFILQLTSGGSRVTGTQTGGVNFSAGWSNNLMCSSNTSLLELTGTTDSAILARTMEVEFGPAGASPEQVEDYQSLEATLMQEQHGTLGMALVTDLLDPDTFKKVKATAKHISGVLSKHLGQDQRYLARLLTVVAVAQVWLDGKYPGQQVFTQDDFTKCKALLTQTASVNKIELVQKVRQPTQMFADASARLAIHKEDDMTAQLGSPNPQPTSFNQLGILIETQRHISTQRGMATLTAIAEPDFTRIVKECGDDMKPVAILKSWAANGLLYKGARKGQPMTRLMADDIRSTRSAASLTSVDRPMVGKIGPSGNSMWHIFVLHGTDAGGDDE